MSSFWLEYIQDGQQREFSFDAPTVSIGRDKSADFVLDHPTVSRQHALIVSNRGTHQLVVLSRGGLTAIDGGQVSGEIDLHDGSEIHFGQLSFVFRSHTAPPRPAHGRQQNGASHGQPAAGWQNGPNGGFQSPGQASSGHQQSQPQQPQTNWDTRQNTGAPGQSGGLASQSGGWQSSPSDAWESGQSGGWDASATSGGWDTAGDGTNGWSEAGDEPSDGIMSWDQIAQSAEEEGAGGQEGATDFERIQAAQAKADRRSKGTNPLVAIFGLLAIVGLIAFTFWPEAPKTIGDKRANIEDEKVFIEWQGKDIDCVGESNCSNAAIASYNVGQSTWEKKDADITNRYVAYKQFDKAEKLLEKGGVNSLPPEMGDVQELKSEVKDELDVIFKRYMINYREHEKRKMYDKMADTLRKIQAYFPDKRCQYHQWTLEKERKMKEAGVYPKSNTLL